MQCLSFSRVRPSPSPPRNRTQEISASISESAANARNLVRTLPTLALALGVLGARRPSDELTVVIFSGEDVMATGGSPSVAPVSFHAERPAVTVADLSTAQWFIEIKARELDFGAQRHEDQSGRGAHHLERGVLRAPPVPPYA